MTLKELKRTYIISDLHFYHNNIIKYCNRPFWKNNFPDSLSMNEYLLKQIDSLPRNSILINLGDVSMINNIDVLDFKYLVHRMSKNNKMLILILGNHDCFKRKPLKGKELEFYKEAGFDLVFNKPIYLNNLDVILSHSPIQLSKNSSVCNIHGHIHNSLLSKEFLNGNVNKYFNASVDVTGFKPVLLTDALNSFNKKICDFDSRFIDVGNF